MKSKKKGIALFSIAIVVFAGLSATGITKPEHENLQILPKDISKADLDSVMNSFEKALGVSCDFCHAKDKNDPEAIDFVSDDKPEKEITRKMMRMTSMINKEYFDYIILYKAGELMAVSCNTCHLGNPRPTDTHN